MVATMLPEDPAISFDWKKYAACRDIGVTYRDNIFFIEGYGAVYDKARSYCARCVVVVDCLIEGIENELGMWGCMSPNERWDVGKDMEVGYSLKRAAEIIWKPHRNRGKVLVPPESIWEYWDV